MAIIHSLARMTATLAGIVQTRLELAAVEMEEQSLRLLAYLSLGLLALVCMSAALLLVGFFIIVLFWDSYRLEAIAMVILAFIAIACAIAVGVRNSFRSRPKMLSFTLAELSKDVDSMKHLGQLP